MSNEAVILTLVLFLPAALLWAILLMRAGKPGRRRVVVGIPQAMRPAQSDERLEGPRIERVQWGGVVATVALAIFIPAYWIPEASRQEAFTERFDEESVARGELVFAVPPPLPEESDPQQFKAVEREIALGMGCANCHSTGDTGQTIPTLWTDPATGEMVRYWAPPLGNVFQRWDEEVVRFTIERGRPGTPMPTWGVEYGGPMTSQMIDDVIAYLKSLPGNQNPPQDLSPGCDDPAADDVACGKEIFAARCSVCHGDRGQGKEERGLSAEEAGRRAGLPPDAVDLETLQKEAPQLVDRFGIWYPGLALWKGDVDHLSENLHYTTIVMGRRFAFMPQFGETPPQGIPAAPFPLSESQIRAVMAYERTL